MPINDAGIELIKSFEGTVLHVYNDSAGLPSVGIGHLIKPGESFTTITEAEADALLQKDLAIAMQAVDEHVRVPINENERAALVSLTFNIAGDKFAHSTLCRLLNAGNKQGAANAFLSWNKATVNGQKVQVKGLTRRRIAERALFLRPV